MAAFCSSCGKPLETSAKFCGQCGAATSPADSAPAAVARRASGVRCQTCGVGTLRLEKRYRMSTPVVAIGYIILIPSLLLVVVFVISMFNLAGLPESDSSSMATGIAFFFAIGAFVGGLLGWLLIMKKKVLVCTHCSAAVPAS